MEREDAIKYHIGRKKEHGDGRSIKNEIKLSFSVVGVVACQRTRKTAVVDVLQNAIIATKSVVLCIIPSFIVVPPVP